MSLSSINESLNARTIERHEIDNSFMLYIHRQCQYNISNKAIEEVFEVL